MAKKRSSLSRVSLLSSGLLRLPLLFSLLTLYVFSPAFGQESSPSSATAVDQSSSAPTGAPSAQKSPAENSLEVTFANGSLSVTARNTALKALSEEIARQTGINIALSPTLESTLVFVQFANVDLETGLREILRVAGITNHAWTYRKSHQPLKIGEWVLNRIFVVAEGAGGGEPPAFTVTPPVPKESPKNTATVGVGKGTPNRESYFDPRASRFVEVAAREVLVRFKKDLPEEEIEQTLQNLGVQIISKHEKFGLYRLKIPETESVANFIRKNQPRPDFLLIEPNFPVSSMATGIVPNDPLFQNQWALERIGATKAWEVTTGNPDVIVAVIDTGIDANHPDLRGKVLPGRNIIQQSENTLDDHGHGTAVAGVIAAATDNNTGMAGVCWACHLLPVKALDARGEGTYADVIEGILWAADNGARVLNLSLGGYVYSQFFGDAVDYAHATGAVLVAAGGNEASSAPLYPAAFPNVIGVSATDSLDRIWPSSNSGPLIDLSAPGVDIRSAALASSYTTTTGTSLSAAHVSGVATLIFSKNLDLSNTQVEQMLYQTADDLGEPGKDEVYGFGRVDVAKAFEVASIEVHDVAVIGIRVAPQTFQVGEATQIIVTVQNQGTFVEKDLWVRVLVNDAPLEAVRAVESIKPGENVEVGFSWTSESESSKIIVRGEISSLFRELNTTNNTKTRYYRLVLDNGQISIKYGLETHRWIGQNAFLLLPASPMRTEIGQFLGLNATYSTCNAGADSGEFILEGVLEEDDGISWSDPLCFLRENRFESHFWDPDGGYYASLPYDFDLNGQPNNESAAARAQRLWVKAKTSYATDKATAYWWLGRVAHLLMDMAVPAHVHLDPHGGLPGFGDDNYEDWMERDNYILYNPSGILTDYKTLNMEAFYNNSWDNYKDMKFDSQNLFKLFLDMAEWTDDLESDGQDGEVHPNSPGDVSDGESKIHGNSLMPQVMKQVAGLYKLFWDETHDTEFPSATIASPTGGSSLSGSVVVAATASDNIGVKRVEFYLDGVRQLINYSAPYGWSWDTTLYSNGSHALVAKAYDEAGNVGTSPTITVTVNNTAADTTPPVISSVQTLASTTAATITWITNEPATGQIEYGTAPCPCTNSTSLDPALKTSHSFTLNGLASSTPYYYRVFSRDAASNLAYSGNNQFVTGSTGNTAPQVTLGKPNGGENWSVGSVQTITWNATDNVAVTSVTLLCSTDGGGNWTTIATDLSNTGSYAWTVPNSPSAMARVGIIARDGNGTTGEDTSNGNFTISSSCSLPATSVLQNISVNGGSYTVSWDTVSGANSYILEEDTSSSFSNPTSFNLFSTSRFFGGKAAGTYYYRVRAVNSCGEGPWSGPKSATVSLDQSPGLITAVSPLDGETNQPLTVDLCWLAPHPGGESLRYTVYVSPSDTDSFFSNNIKVSGQTGTCYTATNLPYKTRVSWGIKATDDTGDIRYSPMFHFNTIADTAVPTGTISINSGALTTDTYSVILFLTATDVGSGVKYMRFRNDDTNWSQWYLFAPQFPWNLADSRYGGQYGLTTYTVYAQFRDNQDNDSTIYNDTIDKVSGKPGNIILKDQFYETIQDAVDAAKAGEVVYLTEGVFTVRGAEGGDRRPHDPNRFVGVVMKPGVTLMGAGAAKTTIEIQGGVYGLVDADNSVVEGVTLVNLTNLPRPAVILLESDSSIIRNNTIRGSSHGVLTSENATKPSTNTQIVGNLITGNTQALFITESAVNMSIVNNTIANNPGFCSVYINSSSTSLINNIIAFNGCGISSGLLPTIRYNDVFNAGGNYSGMPDQTGINGNISADPLFVNSSQGDYRLNSGSPAINVGTNVGIPYAGIAPDMGAFETNATGTIQVLSNRADASFTIIGPQGTYQGGGISWSMPNVPIGVYTITFTPIPNMYSPFYQASSLLSDQTLTFDGTYAQDTVPPSGTMSVNFEEYATADTSVTLSFDLTDEIGGLGAGSQMRFSNDGTSWSPPEPYSSLRKAWDLTTFGGNETPGMKTVHGMVSDALGNWKTFTDTVLYVPNRQTLEVPAQYEQIQEAINAAQPGDIVHVAAGDYFNQDLVLRDGVTLQGTGPSETTFTSNSKIATAPNSQIEGFGGVWQVIAQTGPVIISNNVFRTSPSVIIGSAYGAIVRNNIFTGGGLRIADISGGSLVTVENNTFADIPGTALALSRASPTTRVRSQNNIIAFSNIGVSDTDTRDIAHQHIFSSFNTYWNNTKNFEGSSLKMEAGDIEDDPLFVNRTAGDFHLLSSSSSIDTGHPEARYNDPDGTRNDRGAYGGPRFNTSPVADFSVSPEVGGAGTFFTFDASLSFDTESADEQLTSRWDFDNDGVFDTPFSTQKVVSIQFPDVGMFTIGLEVRDPNGFLDSTSRQITVDNQPPNPPRNPSPPNGATNQPITITLNWSGGDPDSVDTVAYDVYFGTTTDPPLVSSDQPGTTYAPPTLSYQTFYYWRVVAKDQRGAAVSSPVWSFLTGQEPLPQVSTNLTAKVMSSSQVDLIWTDTASNEVGFKIERKIGANGTYSQIGVAGANATTYNDQGLSGGTTYCYRVRAFNGTGDSGPSNETCATTPVPCTYALSPTSRSHGAGTETGNVSVTTQSGCPRTAKSNVSWITVTSGSSGTGNGIVSYSVAANTGSTARTGTLTIAGQTFTVQQNGLCLYSGTIVRVTTVPGNSPSTIYFRLSALSPVFFSSTTSDAKLINAALHALRKQTGVTVAGTATTCPAATAGGNIGTMNFLIVNP